MRPRLEVLTIETPDGWVAELIDGADIDVDTGRLSWPGKTWERRPE